mmetsp:Transcript_3741/g.5443  ORF Transcript_3741/g.5443 Transcript_3741/m.5443 type:complete len:283 (-) Transcript_3741:545-1393(-)
MHSRRHLGLRRRARLPQRRDLPAGPAARGRDDGDPVLEHGADAGRDPGAHELQARGAGLRRVREGRDLQRDRVQSVPWPGLLRAHRRCRAVLLRDGHDRRRLGQQRVPHQGLGAPRGLRARVPVEPGVGDGAGGARGDEDALEGVLRLRRRAVPARRQPLLRRRPFPLRAARAARQRALRPGQRALAGGHGRHRRGGVLRGRGGVLGGPAQVHLELRHHLQRVRHPPHRPPGRQRDLRHHLRRFGLLGHRRHLHYWRRRRLQLVLPPARGGLRHRQLRLCLR